MLQAGDEEVRGALTRAIARLGHAPSIEALAAALDRSIDEVGAALDRLHAAHALLLHPGTRRPWVVHPFALAPAACWVERTRPRDENDAIDANDAIHARDAIDARDARPRGYWASCLYCALGIAAALREDCEIATRLGGEGEATRYRVVAGELLDSDGVFHLSTPVARWWDNVVFACSSFQPFRDEAEVDAWCARHALPRGAVLTLPQLWRFASDWYGAYLQQPWRKRTASEAQALFERHDLRGPFWSVA